MAGIRADRCPDPRRRVGPRLGHYPGPRDHRHVAYERIATATMVPPTNATPYVARRTAQPSAARRPTDCDASVRIRTPRVPRDRHGECECAKQHFPDRRQGRPIEVGRGVAQPHEQRWRGGARRDVEHQVDEAKGVGIDVAGMRRVVPRLRQARPATQRLSVVEQVALWPGALGRLGLAGEVRDGHKRVFAELERHFLVRARRLRMRHLGGASSVDEDPHVTAAEDIGIELDQLEAVTRLEVEARGHVRNYAPLDTGTEPMT